MINLSEIEWVVENSENVSINKPKLEDFAREISSHKPLHWMEKCPVDLSDLSQEELIAFLFTFNAISFSYWGNPSWRTDYDRGTWSMIGALKKAVDQGKPILEPIYLANLSLRDLETILEGNTRIPLLEERLMILNELGRSIHNYSDFVNDTNSDAQQLVEKVLAEIPSFRDFSIYKGQRVDFNKRAQLLASDIGYLFGFENQDKSTACADYILPLVLEYGGILDYSKELASKVDQRIEIPKNSEEEVEIRANTIHSVELIKAKSGLTAMQVNDYLWLAGDLVPAEQYYHLTRTTAY